MIAFLSRIHIINQYKIVQLWHKIVAQLDVCFVEVPIIITSSLSQRAVVYLKNLDIKKLHRSRAKDFHLRHIALL